MQQEILLPLHSAFAQQQLNKVKNEESKKYSRKGTYEEDCINSLLQEILPIFFKPTSENKMYLWQIHSGVSFLQFEFCEVPANIEKISSLDPHNFLFVRSYN